MPREPQNVGASVRARLLDRARAEKSDFQILLTRYAIERLLYRLGVSGHREKFILKGAMLFVTWVADPFRPTRDLDLLGFGDSDANAIAETFRVICKTPVPDDGVSYDITGLLAAPIRTTADYGGVRVRTTATIDRARIPIQIDVGFGDAVTPAPVEIDYPAMLGNPQPRIRAYPVETVVAEKFEALVTLGMANTRMKDFYDLWLIAQRFEFRQSILIEAINRTFKRRGTTRPLEPPVGLTDEFANVRATQWRAFMGRDQIVAAPKELAPVVSDLRGFLMPVLINSTPAEKVWPRGGPWAPESTIDDA